MEPAGVEPEPPHQVLTPGTLRRGLLRGVVIGVLLGGLPLLVGDLRGAWVGFLMGGSLLFPSLVEFWGERQPYSMRNNVRVSVVASLLAYAGFAGAYLQGVYLQEGIGGGGLDMDWIGNADGGAFLTLVTPAWIVGLTTFQRLHRYSGSLGCVDMAAVAPVGPSLVFFAVWVVTVGGVEPGALGLAALLVTLVSILGGLFLALVYQSVDALERRVWPGD